MKTKSTASLARAALLATMIGVAPGFANTNDHDKNSATRDRDTNAMNRDNSSADGYASRSAVRIAPEDARGHRAGDLLGRDVIGSRGEKLGDLNDIVVDASTGKITHLVVGSGGILGIGEHLRVAPIDQCRITQDNIRIDVNSIWWKQAPVFTKQQLLALNIDNRTERIAAFFENPGLQDTDADSRSDSRGQDSSSRSTANREQPRQFVLVSDIRGKDVRSGNDEIGEIDDVIIQPVSDRAVALFDADDTYAGADHDYIVPLEKLNGFHGDQLTTSLGRRDFSGAREFTDASWSTPVVYVSTFHVWPVYADSNESGERGNMNSTDSASRSGNTPVAAVREAVRAETNQADGKADVRVASENETIILRGTVPTEAMKDRIEDRAEEAASGWEIDNQLRVASR